MGCSKLGDAIDQNMSVDENLKFNKDTILRLRGSKDCAVRAYVEMCTIIDRIKRADLPGRGRDCNPRGGRCIGLP